MKMFFFYHRDDDEIEELDEIIQDTEGSDMLPHTPLPFPPLPPDTK